MKEIKYVEVGGILYPDLKMKPQKEVQLTRFGRMKLEYLKEYKGGLYTKLLLSGEFNDYLQKFDKEANELYGQLIEQYKIKWNITEDLKEENQIKWIQEMNNIKNSVEEFIINEESVK